MEMGIVAEMAARTSSALMSTQMKATVGLDTRITILEHKKQRMFNGIFALNVGKLQPMAMR